LASALRRSDAARALAVYDHTLRHLAEIRGNSVIDRAEAEALAGSAYSLRRMGRSPETRRRLNAAFDRLTQLKLYPAEKVTPGSVTDKILRALADHEAANRNIRRALDIYQKLLNQMRAARLEPETSLEDAVDLSSVYQAIADLHRRNREPGRVDATLRSAWNCGAAGTESSLAIRLFAANCSRRSGSRHTSTVVFLASFPITYIDESAVKTKEGVDDSGHDSTGDFAMRQPGRHYCRSQWDRAVWRWCF
jgi:hypothetical protein